MHFLSYFLPIIYPLAANTMRVELVGTHEFNTIRVELVGTHEFHSDRVSS